MTKAAAQANSATGTPRESVPITVVTPVYNGEHYIAETIASVAAQIPPPVRHIVIDDGSTDGTREVLEDFAETIDIVHQENRGEAATVNLGISLATTDLVAVVNADDPVLPSWLAASYSAFEEDETLSATYPDWLMIGTRGETIREIRTHPFDLHVMLAQHLCIPGPGAVFRKSHIPDGVVRVAERGSSADFDFWLRLGLKGRVLRLPQVLATWRSHDAGTSLSGGDTRMANDKIGVIESFFARTDLPQEVTDLRKQALSAAYFNAGLLGLRNSSVPAARLFARSFAARPFWPDNILPSQRRSLPHMAYAAFQPLSGYLHAFLGPILPARFRSDALKSQRFGERKGDG